MDVSPFDLENETDREGLWFLPMTRPRLTTLDKRPNFDVDFFYRRERSCIGDSEAVDHEIATQLLCDQDGGFQTYQSTSWRLRR